MMNLFDDLFGDVVQELEDTVKNSYVDKEEDDKDE